jgi:hypothetical protein
MTIARQNQAQLSVAIRKQESIFEHGGVWFEHRTTIAIKRKGDASRSFLIGSHAEVKTRNTRVAEFP